MSPHLEEKLEKIFLKIFQNMDKKEFSIDKGRNYFENWDSLTHLQLVSEIESVFKISLEMDEIIDIQKPSDFIAIIEKKRGKKV